MKEKSRITENGVVTITMDSGHIIKMPEQGEIPEKSKPDNIYDSINIIMGRIQSIENKIDQLVETK